MPSASNLGLRRGSSRLVLVSTALIAVTLLAVFWVGGGRPAFALCPGWQSDGQRGVIERYQANAIPVHLACFVLLAGVLWRHVLALRRAGAGPTRSFDLVTAGVATVSALCGYVLLLALASVILVPLALGAACLWVASAVALFRRPDSDRGDKRAARTGVMVLTVILPVHLANVLQAGSALCL